MALAFADQIVPAGTIDNNNVLFTLPNAPAPALSLILALNGLTQNQGGDFTLAGTTITFNVLSTPQVGDRLEAWFRYDDGTGGFGSGPGSPFVPTVDDLLRSSFRCIGQLRPGYGHSPSERVDALLVLNGMLESWSIDDLNCFVTLISSFELVPGKWVYSIGPTGDWVTSVRPPKIDKATLVVMTNPAQPLRLDLDLRNADQYQLINLQGTAS